MIIQRTLLILSFPTALNHVTYLKQFLMNKVFTVVVETCQKWEVNSRINLLLSNKEKPEYQSKIFWTVLDNLDKMFLLFIKTFNGKNSILLF